MRLLGWRLLICASQACAEEREQWSMHMMAPRMQHTSRCLLQQRAHLSIRSWARSLPVIQVDKAHQMLDFVIGLWQRVLQFEAVHLLLAAKPGEPLHAVLHGIEALHLQAGKSMCACFAI